MFVFTAIVAVYAVQKVVEGFFFGLELREYCGNEKGESGVGDWDDPLIVFYGS